MVLVLVGCGKVATVGGGRLTCGFFLSASFWASLAAITVPSLVRRAWSSVDSLVCFRVGFAFDLDDEAPSGRKFITPKFPKSVLAVPYSLLGT